MTEILLFAVIGLGTGAIYALSALGIVLVYRSSGVINFAHGAIGMIGVLVFVKLQGPLGWPLAAVAGILASALVGVLVQVGVMRQLRNSTMLMRVIATLAILVVVQGVAGLFIVTDLTPVPAYLPQFSLFLLGGSLPFDRIVILLVAVVLTIVLTVVYRVTIFGLRSSAVAENERTAAIYGVSSQAVSTINWAIGSALSAVAGILLVPITGLSLTALTLILIPALSAALLGGFKSFPLTLAGGLIIGVVQSELQRFLPLPGLGTLVPFVLIIAVLLLRSDKLSFKSIVGERFPSAGNGFINAKWVVIVAAIALALVWFVFNPIYIDAAILSISVATILLSLVVVTGYAGQLSLAQYTLAGFGAWVAGTLAANFGLPFPLVLVIGVLAALPLGFLVGLPSVRIRGVSLAVVTLGVAAVFDAMLFNNIAINGGFGGMNIGFPDFFGIKIDVITNPKGYFTFSLVVFVLLALMVANIRRGTTGRRLLAVRTNERAASALGISVPGAKLYAFVVGSGIAAAGGVLLGFRNIRLLFDAYASAESQSALSEAVVGGIGWITGPLLGSQLHTGSIGGTFIDGLIHGAGQALPIISGALLLLVILTNPDGIASVNAKAYRAIRDRIRKPKVKPIDLEAMAVRGAAAAPPEPRRLEVRDASVSFGGVKAVTDANLVVEPGRITGLIGPNGAGKSTMIEMISGFVSGSGGQVMLGDQDISKFKPHQRARAGVARSFQSLELFEDMSVLDNIRAASDSHGGLPLVGDLVAPSKRTLSAPAIAAIREFDLEPVLGTVASDLAFGTRRLVAIARAVAGDPAVLMLDEPAAGLSDTEKTELGRLLRRLVETRPMGILLVEHDMDLVLDVCDSVVALEFGRVIATGTPAEVREDPEVVRAYLGLDDSDEPVPSTAS
jgi:ABC-type branched-subunit amino acid transport system ATPase component/branched-subunit amino acid ABC-type transport system permease component